MAKNIQNEVVCRRANGDDYNTLSHMIRGKRLDYLTTTHIVNDLRHEYMYVAEYKGKIVAFCSIVNGHDPEYYGLKRLFIPNKKYRHRGVGDALLHHIIWLYPRVGATPWEDNIPMRKLLERHGFVYQYTFNHIWMYYRRD